MSKWTEDTTLKFVEEYLKRECLWNIRSTSFRNKQAKQRAIIDIVSAMTIPNFGVKEVEAKIKSIRSTYSQELKKIKDSTKSGSGTDDIYKPNLKWFAIMHEILNSANISDARKTNNNLENDGESSGDNSSVQPTDDEISQPALNIEQEFAVPNTTNATTRKRRLNSLHSLVDKVSMISRSPSTTESTEHEFDQFGKSVASQLKAMPFMLALKAQKNIQNYLSDLRITQLMNTGRISSPVYSSATPSPSSTYNVESPEPQLTVQSTVSPQHIQTETENHTNVYSPDVASQSIITSDILSQAIYNNLIEDNAVNLETETENTITMFSPDATSQIIISSDCLSQAISSITNNNK